ncbi:MAG: hypothetical protein M1817_004853 [Caeruleum heppii]|nr:MAG: hypothetical protein M1817_004853 [Caeruleum heppii]
MTLPAPAALGSSLLDGADEQLPHRTRTGVRSIDEAALAGGFTHGSITTLSGAAGTGKSLMALHVIAKYLLTSVIDDDEDGQHGSAGVVAVIDTTGSFSPLLLRDIVREKLGRRAKEQGDEGIRQILDRVRVMRVFDFRGVVEALGEVAEGVEGRGTEGMMRGEVGDSEEEGEEEEKEGVKGSRVKVGMIVVDNITNVVSPLMGKGQSQGHALLQTFSRSLSLLTVHHSICTILINAAVANRPAASDVTSRRRDDGAEHVSVFASTHGKPALGRSFLYCADTHVFLSKVPKTRVDAELAYGGGVSAGYGGYNEVGVCEVIADRKGGREGRWGCFAVDGSRIHDAV